MSDESDPKDELSPLIETMLNSVEPKILPTDRRAQLKDRLFQRIDDAGSLFVVRCDEGKWNDFAEGIQIKLLHRDADSGAETSLWRFASGARVDGHTHAMDEECLVLEGDIEIGGELLLPGDFLLGRRGVDHPAAVSPSGALLLIRSQPYLNP